MTIDARADSRYGDLMTECLAADCDAEATTEIVVTEGDLDMLYAVCDLHAVAVTTGTWINYSADQHRGLIGPL